MKALQDLRIFMRTVDTGSLSAAARSLGLTPAATSAAVKRLEGELGVQLLLRSTRSLRLTSAGAHFFEQCRPALEAIEQAGQQVAAGEQVGVLRLAAPSDLGRHMVLDWLDAFQALNPGVQLRLHLADRRANILNEPVDAALRYGRPIDWGVLALPLAPDNRRVLCAAPSYLARRGVPATPQDLRAHDCVSFMLGGDVYDRWRFTRAGEAAGGEAAVTVRVEPRNVADDGDVVRRWVVQGRGIAYKSRLDLAADLAQGRLQALCTDWVTEPAGLYMVVPGPRQFTPLLRSLRDFIVQRLAAEPAAP